MTITRLTHIATTVESAGTPIISADGRFLALTNSRGATSFIDPALKSTLGLLVVDINTGTARSLVLDPPFLGWGSSPTIALGITADGSKILLSNFRDLVSLPDASPHGSLFLEDTGNMALAVIAQHPNGFLQLTGYPASFSADGSHIAVAGSEYGPDGTPLASGVFELDTRTGAVTRIAVTLQVPNASNDNPHPTQTAISADGRYVVFDSAGDGGQHSAHFDLFVYDAVTRDTRAVNASTDGTPGDGAAYGFSISGNGRYVMFGSASDNLVPNTPGGLTSNVFVKDLQTGAVVLASADAYGGAGSYSLKNSAAQGISNDGRYVVFWSTDSFGFTELDTSTKRHVFVKDMVTGAIALVNSAPETIGLDAYSAAISGDGTTIVFQVRKAVDGAGSSYEYQTFATPLPAFAPVTVNDTMKGTAGADTLAGALGDDDYFVNHRGDIVLEYAGQGRDTIHTSVDYTLPANVEALVIEGGGAVSISGNELDNELVGNGASNVLRGGAGDDILEGGGGIDSLFGDAGNDTARFAGKLADYSIKGGAVATVTAKPGAPVVTVASLTSIETLLFSDATVTLVTDGIAAQAYRLYQAAFDRTPDQAGLGFWIAQMQKGLDLTSVSAQFVQSGEFKELFGQSPSNASFVNLLYQHVLHRGADEQGAAFWTDVLDRHLVTAADVLVRFSESPENQAALIGVITNGIAYQPYHG